MQHGSTIDKTRKMVEIAVLSAILLVLEVTGIGFLKTGPLEFTIMQIPVVIGAIVLGPSAGAILGGVFGLTSFWQCLGKSAFGVTLMGISPISAFIVCFVPRVLMGLFCGLIFQALKKIDKKHTVSYYVASLLGTLMNTAFFMLLLLLLFGNSEFIVGMQNGKSLILFVATFVGIQGVLEAVICAVVGGSVTKALCNMSWIYQKKK